MKVTRMSSIALKLQNQIDFFWILPKKLLEKLAERANRISPCGASLSRQRCCLNICITLVELTNTKILCIQCLWIQPISKTNITTAVMSSPELSKLLDGRGRQQQIGERAGRILTCTVSKFPCSVLLALSTNEIQAQISWVGQSTIAECPWAFKIARWKKTTTTDRGESRPHCRAARAG